MEKLNDKWIEQDNLNILDYYINDGLSYLKFEKFFGIPTIVPPFIINPVLTKVQNDLSHLSDHNRKIYVFDDSGYSSQILKKEYPCEDIERYTFNPILYFFNYYDYNDESCSSESSESDIINCKELVYFIKNLTWDENCSEGCGGMNQHYEIRTYLGETINDIIKFAMNDSDREKFLKKEYIN